jgi:GNAT superfamily N-acetyltransferase
MTGDRSALAGRDLAWDVTDNFIRCFSLLAEHAERGAAARFGPVVAALTGAAGAWFNPVFLVAPDRTEESDLRRAVEFAAAHAPTFAVHVPVPVPDAVSAALTALGLGEDAEEIPGMAMSPLHVIPRQSGPVQIAEVTEAHDWPTLQSATRDGFELTDELVATVFPPSLRTVPDIRWYVARIDETVVGTAVLVRTDDVAGIYNISVLPAYQRRGFGAALSWHAVAAGRDAGCRVAVLQSSAAGYDVYRRMGFETVVGYRSYTYPD